MGRLRGNLARRAGPYTRYPLQQGYPAAKYGKMGKRSGKMVGKTPRREPTGNEEFIDKNGDDDDKKKLNSELMNTYERTGKAEKLGISVPRTPNNKNSELKVKSRKLMATADSPAAYPRSRCKSTLRNAFRFGGKVPRADSAPGSEHAQSWTPDPGRQIRDARSEMLDGNPRSGTLLGTIRSGNELSR